MRITRFGAKAILFYAMLTAAFFAAPYLNLFFLLLVFSTVLAVVSAWWTFRNVTGIDGAIEPAPPMPAGAGQIAVARLHCAARHRHSLAIDLVIAGRRHGVLADCDLRPNHDHRADILLPALPRGVHATHGARVVSVFPFGMLRSWRRLAAPAAIVVYPAPADLARYRDRSDTAGQGLGGAHAEEMGPAGLRDFRDGDELRSVHWKASARRHALVVREFEGDAAPGVEVVLDLRAADAEFEEALSLISALALECQTNKELFTLHAQDHRGCYGEGHASFDALLHYLAAAAPLESGAAAPPPVSPAVLRLPLQRGAHQSGRRREDVRC